MKIGKKSQVNYRSPEQQEECDYLIIQIKRMLGHTPRSRELLHSDVIEKALYNYADYLDNK